MRFKRSGVTEDILLTRSNIGNISNVNRNGTNTARGYNTAHGLTTLTGGTTQTYDTDGNTTTLHTNVTAVWDDAGRMKNTNVPAGATAGIQGLNENGYVGGNRIWKKITRSGSVVEHRVYIHAGPDLVAEYNAGVAASTPVQEYVYAGEIDSLVAIRRSDATKYGVTRNRQWSITALHDLANGTVVERYAYEITGKRTIYAANGTTVRTTSSYGNPFGYTNRWHDEDSGLMYFRARYYNPLTGEFLSRDPMEFVDGMSLYRGYFVANGIDSLGLLVAWQDDEKPKRKPPIKNPFDGRDIADENRKKAANFKYVTWAPSPEQAKNIPWHHKILPEGTLGRTEGWAIMFCKCKRCDWVPTEQEKETDRCPYLIECTMHVNQTVFIDLSQVPNPHTRLEWVYGHEQVHVNNKLLMAIDFAVLAELELSSVACTFNSLRDCETFRLTFVETYNRAMKTLTQKDVDHKNDHPKRGEDILPIDGIIPDRTPAPSVEIEQ